MCSRLTASGDRRYGRGHVANAAVVDPAGSRDHRSRGRKLPHSSHRRTAVDDARRAPRPPHGRTRRRDDRDRGGGSPEAPYRLPWTVGKLREVVHPYLGFVYEASRPNGPRADDPLRDLGFFGDATPIPRAAGANDFVVIVFGGSVAGAFESFGGAEAVVARIASLPGVAGKKVHVGVTAMAGFKQPQQLMALALLLSQGFHIDVAINLDGYNDATLGPVENVPRKVASFFPRHWALRIQDVPDRARLEGIGMLQVLRNRRERWARALDHRALRWSSALGLLWKVGDRRLEYAIAARERSIVDEAPKRRGWMVAPPRPASASKVELLPEVVASWRDGSIQMNRLARANGARYFHFLQPNQYLPGSKPMDARERAVAIAEKTEYGKWVELAYPAMIESGPTLRAAGVRFFGLARAFAETNEPLYFDNCCHFHQRGYRILGELMADAIAETWDAGSPELTLPNRSNPERPPQSAAGAEEGS